MKRCRGHTTYSSWSPTTMSKCRNLLMNHQIEVMEVMVTFTIGWSEMKSNLKILYSFQNSMLINKSPKEILMLFLWMKAHKNFIRITYFFLFWGELFLKGIRMQ